MGGVFWGKYENRAKIGIFVKIYPKLENMKTSTKEAASPKNAFFGKQGFFSKVSSKISHIRVSCLKKVILKYPIQGDGLKKLIEKDLSMTTKNYLYSTE